MSVNRSTPRALRRAWGPARSRVLRRRVSGATLAALAVVASLALLSSSADAGGHSTRSSAAIRAATTPELPARESDLLVRQSGVNIALLDGTSAYGDFPVVLRRLRQLGIQHVRMSFSPTRKDLADEIGELYKYGIHSELVMSDDANLSELPAAVLALTKLPRGAVDGVEPMNEWNYYGPSNWAAQDRAFSQRLYSLVRAQPSLDTVKVLGPSLALRQGYTDLGNLSSSLDYGNIHLYPGGGEPNTRVDDNLAQEATVAGDKPIVVTEAGYHNDLNCDCTHPPITEHFAAIYEPRLFLNYFLKPNVARVYQFELYDRSSSSHPSYHGFFGLLHANNTVKPVFGALRNLMRLTEDPGPAFTTTPLAASISSDDPSIQHVLLERRDGSYTLFLWRPISVWDQRAQQPAPVHGAKTTVTFGQPISSATVYSPSKQSLPVSTLQKPTQVSLPMNGEVEAIRIVPTG